MGARGRAESADQFPPLDAEGRGAYHLGPSRNPRRALGHSVFVRSPPMGMAYPKRQSKVKRKRKIGFRARMATKAGRKIMNNKRRVGRSLNVADK